MPRYEVLPGFPMQGPMPVPFSASEWGAAWSGHSEGLVVRFLPDTPDQWIGNFQPGSGGWEGVLEHPNGAHVIVVARGQGYVVDPETCKIAVTFPRPIQHVVPLPKLDAILFSDGLGFEALKKDGIWWRSPRISWDEMRNLKIEGTTLHGEASAPTHDGHAWTPFTLDLMSGQCKDGVHDEQMREAIPVTTESIKTVYVRLLGEGTDVFRPVTAVSVSDSKFTLIGSENLRPEDENWEFPLGTVVIAEPRVLSGDTVLVAVARAKLS